MIQVSIDNSESRIIGLSPKEHSILKEILSYEDNPTARFFKGFRGSQKKSLLSKSGTFPTGVLYLILTFLENKEHQVKDLRVKPDNRPRIDYKLDLGLEPYQEQKEIVEACIEHSRGIISAVTGFGKSITMALLVDRLKLKTLIVVPNIELKRQLTESFTKYFGSKALSNITIENIDSSSLYKTKDYDVLIIDESHHVAAKTYRKLNKEVWNGIFYRFYFTATPFRARTEEHILFESVAGQIIYTVDYATCVEKGYTVPVEAFYIDIPVEVGPPIEYASYNAAYQRLITNNDTRNAILQELLVKTHSNKIATLCLVKEIKHGENLSSDGAFPFVNGQNDERHLISAFNSRKINVLIGTTGVLGEGVDTKPCEYVVIATPVKSKNLFMQMAGRAFRRYPGKERATIILLRDYSHKWFKASFREQCKILKEEFGIIPSKIDI